MVRNLFRSKRTRSDGEETILFLPESRRTFRGEVVPTRIHPLSDRAEVREYIEATSAFNRAVASMQTSILQAGRGPSRSGRNEACPCGSGTKFKKCCGRRAG